MFTICTTKALELILYLASSIKFTSSEPYPKINFIIILPSKPWFPKYHVL
jgi:hypothetical protein